MSDVLELNQLTGIAAILNFPLSDLEDLLEADAIAENGHDDLIPNDNHSRDPDVASKLANVSIQDDDDESGL